MIRSAYKCNMRLYRDADTLTPVQWSFVPFNAPTLGLPTAFGSRAWEYTEEPSPLVGEQNQRSWTGGLPPVGFSSGGGCGSAEQWLNGCSVNDPLPATWPGSNVPRCCVPPAIRVAAGVTLGSKAPVHACRVITDLPTTLNVTFDSSTNPWQVDPGTTWELNQVPEGSEGFFQWPNFITEPFPVEDRSFVIQLRQVDDAGCDYQVELWQVEPYLDLRSGPTQHTWIGSSFEPFEGICDTPLFPFPSFSAHSFWTVEQV